jgi:TniQ
MLTGLPRADPWEAPGSWLTRVALSQGESVEDLARGIGVDLGADADLAIACLSTNKLTKFGIDLTELHISRRVCQSLAASGCDRRRFLLYGALRRERYRFCPVCLYQSRNPTVPIHWRFTAWRVCPMHQCMMEDYCPHCNSELLLPANLITGGPQRLGVAHVGLCNCCAEPLSDVDPVFIGDEPRVVEFGSTGVMHIRNGRALLAALYFGELRLEGSQRAEPLSMLQRLDGDGLLANDPKWLSASGIRRIRLRQEGRPFDVSGP